MPTYTLSLDLLHICLLVANVVLIPCLVWQVIVARRHRQAAQHFYVQLLAMQAMAKSEVDRALEQLGQQFPDEDDKGEDWKSHGRN